METQNIDIEKRCSNIAEADEACADIDSVESLIRNTKGRSNHIVFNGSALMVNRAVETVRDVYRDRRCAFSLSDDGTFERETAISYLRLFTRIAGCGRNPHVALSKFGLEGKTQTRIRKLTQEEKTLLNYARMSLFNPQVCFFEQPLTNLETASRELVLRWLGELFDTGTVFITVGQSRRNALLMPGNAWEETEGRWLRLDEQESEVFPGDEEPLAFKVVTKAGTTTLLLEPKDIDFIESQGRANYAYVRGELYPTTMTMDELEQNLTGFGFFRSHRSYLVNIQRIARIERCTRSSFNLTLSNPEGTAIPLAKGRATHLRQRFGQ
jgi:ABC-2 type transport system ATP-binding protein